MLRMPLWAVLLVVGTCLVSEKTAASKEFSATTHVHTHQYASPSGDVTLGVDPEDEEGCTGATYTLARNGHVLWTGFRSFALFDAAVSDDGIVAGYTYTNSPGGFCDRNAADKFRIIVMDSRGTLSRDEMMDQPVAVIDGPLLPCGLGTILIPAADAVVIRMWTPGDEEERWRVYRLSTGESVTSFLPSRLSPYGDQPAELAQAVNVAGTPLILAHWIMHQRRTGDTWARFALLSVDGEEVWTREVPHDYDLSDEQAEQDLVGAVRQSDSIIRAEGPGTFVLREVASSTLVTYTVTSATKGSAWLVAESSRLQVPSFPREATRHPTAPEIPLAFLGSFILDDGSHRSRSPVRDIISFDIDQQNRIGLLRGELNGAVSFVILDASGNVEAEIPTELKSTDHIVCTSIDGGGWILGSSGRGFTAKASLWSVDGPSGRMIPLPVAECPQIKALSGTPRGGFVALVELHERSGVSGYTWQDELRVFEANGRLLWTGGQAPARSDATGPCDGSATGGEGGFEWADDVGCLPDGRIVVLQGVGHKLHLYAHDGKYLRAVQFGEDGLYVSDLAVDSDEEVIVAGYRDGDVLLRLGLDGTVRQKLRVHNSDGETLRVYGRPAISADGAWWVNDGTCLLRSGPDGAVTRTLGAPPSLERLGTIRQIATDGHDRVYALDHLTLVVHVFDSTGAALYCCDASCPLDSDPALTVSDVGDVHMSCSGDSPPIHFSPNGTRVQGGPWAPSDGSELVYQPKTDHWLAWGRG